MVSFGIGRKHFLLEKRREYMTFFKKLDKRIISIVTILIMTIMIVLSLFVNPVHATTGEQYGYDETPQAKVKVYFNISSDGKLLKGNDKGKTVLGRVPVEVPYFDVGDYGLAEFRRYHTNGNTPDYIDNKVVKRPTLLHAYLYILQKYYLGLPESKMNGENTPLGKEGKQGVVTIEGNEAYEDNLKALVVTGVAKSLYMQNFWGHDENLMYYRNHVYPLMSKGVGSTSDYILLSDGDVIDVAMFKDWTFYQRGFFTAFDKDAYDANTNKPLKFSTLKSGTQSVTEGNDDKLHKVENLNVEIYDSKWNKLETIEGNKGDYTYTFKKTGKYYIVSADKSAGTDEACAAPAVSTVTVKDGNTEKQHIGDVNGDGEINKIDIQKIIDWISGSALSDEQKKLSDVNGDKKINSVDISLMYRHMNGELNKFPVDRK